MIIDLKASSRQLRKIVIAFLVCNFLLLLATAVINIAPLPINHLLKLIRYQFDLSSENNAAVWYSSALLFICSMLALVCFCIDSRRFKHGSPHLLNYGWIVFAGCFGLLSFDELGSIHEHIGNSLGFSDVGNTMIGGDNSGWILFYILVAMVGFFMLFFSVVRLRNAPGSLVLLIVGLLFYLSNPFQESFEISSMNASNDVSQWQRPLHLLIIEEGTEIYGSLCFIVSILLYGIYASHEKYGKKNVLRLRLHVHRDRFLSIATVSIICVFAAMMLIYVMFGQVTADTQTGVPRSWLPSMMAFTVAMYALHKYAPNPASRIDGSANQRFAYLFLSLVSFLTSIYYGCDRFGLMVWNHRATNMSIRVFMTIAIVSGFAFSLPVIQIRALRIILSTAFALVVASIFAPHSYAPELGVVAFTTLASILIANDFPKKEQSLA
jgi:hypothetical protein